MVHWPEIVPGDASSRWQDRGFPRNRMKNLRQRHQSIRFRSLEMLFVMAMASAWLIVRLVLIQVVHAPVLTADAASIHIHRLTLPATRGDIVDTNGTVLAMDVPRDQVVAAPQYIDTGAHGKQAAMRTGKILARYLPFSAKLLGQVLDHKTAYALLDRSVSLQVGAKISALGLTGISVTQVSGREYPNGTLASQVLGMVGSSGNGLAGIEYADNAFLSGHAGSWLVNTDPQQNPMPQWQIAYKPPVPGDSVQLTIDANIEAVAQKWLAWGVHRAHAQSGTVIILNPHTGAVDALANYPNFNPNNYYTATSREMVDFGVQTVVPPGSIFKPVTASAALTSGLYTPHSMFYTKGYFMVDGVRINDWKPGGWGWISFTRGLELSSDQVFGEVALHVGVHRLYNMVKAYGFNHPSGVGLPGDANGIWLPESQVNPVDLATMGFGQGFAATPIQVAAADATIANHGAMMQPHIVKAILNPKGQVVKKTPVKVENRPVSATVAQQIEHMMVLEATYGTGIPAQVPGYVIGGKTGTAQLIVHGKTSSSDFASSYLGFGPVPHPRFIMLVMIKHPVGSLFYGDQVSAPVWQHIATFLFHYWGIKPYATGNNGADPRTASKHG